MKIGEVFFTFILIHRLKLTDDCLQDHLPVIKVIRFHLSFPLQILPYLISCGCLVDS